jgi:hypothetical protein
MKTALREDEFAVAMDLYLVDVLSRSDWQESCPILEA